MRRLSLIRHAHAAPLSEDLSDFERPLDARGHREATAVSSRLAPLLAAPFVLIASPALRARSTAQIFAQALGVAADRIHLVEAIYEASPGELLALVNSFPDTTTHAVLFGHNPGFSDLASLLIGRPLDLPTCAAAGLCLDIADWRHAVPGCAQLERLLTPADGN